MDQNPSPSPPCRGEDPQWVTQLGTLDSVKTLGAEMDPARLRQGMAEENTGSSHRWETQEAPTPDSTPGDPGDPVSRAGVRLLVRADREQGFSGICKQPSHCCDSHI